MLIALTSVKGSPGVTTFTVALAANWPAAARRVVVECDPAGGDLAQRFVLPPSPGLLSLAAAARGQLEPEAVWNHTQPLVGEVRVMPGPSGSHQARAALSGVTASGSPLYGAGQLPGVALFVDCGRMDPGSPAEPVIRKADVLLLVSGTHSDELAHLAVRLHELGRAAARPCLVLAGQGHSTAEVERELGIPVMARIPHNPGAAAALTGHAVAGRREKGGLVRAAGAVARSLLGGTVPTQATGVPAALGTQVSGVPPQQIRTSGVRVVPPELPHNGAVLRKDVSS